MNKTIIWTLVSVIAIGAVVYFYHPQKTETVEAPTNEIANESSDDIVTEKKISVTEEDTTEYGTMKVSFDGDIKTTEDCKTSGCFEEKFKQCEKATQTVELEAPFLGKVTYQSEIIREDSNGCVMKTKYLASEEPSFAGKEMTCTYDNTLSIDAATEKLFEGIAQGTAQCTGSLFEIFKDMYNPQ